MTKQIMITATSGSGTKRTFQRAPSMSTFESKADIQLIRCNLRFLTHSGSRAREFAVVHNLALLADTVVW
jgi:hypothetical protein